MLPVNKNATIEAKKLLNYITNVPGKGIITGQHTQTRGMEEVVKIESLSGKKPALCGFEMLSYSPNIHYEDASIDCTTEVDNNRDTMQNALEWGKDNGIVALTWHWFSPLGGRDKSFYTEHTDFDASKVLIDGTDERKAFYHDLDVIAEQLKKFYDEKIPVLWRPFHESEGTWFWWGAKGPDVARKLYRLVYDYYVNTYHFDNLLWVWNSPLPEGYPGDDIVDIISMDTYAEAGVKTDYKAEYERLIKITSAKKPVALAEIGILPDLSILSESKVPWCYFMTWSTVFIMTENFNTNNDIKEAYTNAYAITHDSTGKIF